MELQLMFFRQINEDVSHHTATFETGLSDCHELKLIFFKAYFKKLPPKNIEYRNYKNFNENNFVYELDQELRKGSIY